MIYLNIRIFKYSKRKPIYVFDIADICHKTYYFCVIDVNTADIIEVIFRSVFIIAENINIFYINSTCFHYFYLVARVGI